MWRRRPDDTDPSMPRTLQWALVASLAPAFGLGWWGALRGEIPNPPPRTTVVVATTAGVTQTEPATEDSPPIVMAVAELYRTGAATNPSPDVPPSHTLTYPFLPGTHAFAWPDGAADGWVDSGIGFLVLPHWERGADPQLPASRLAVANLAERPGFTYYVLLLFDPNGLVDYVCQYLNERQLEYIDLDTWGYINRGFVGHAVISADFWEHDVFDEQSAFVRNTMGLAATIVEARPALEGGRDLSGVRHTIPMDIGVSAEQQERYFRGWSGLCVRGPGLWRPSPTPDPQDSPTPTPTPTATRTPWPTPRAPASRAERAPALRFPAAGSGFAGVIDGTTGGAAPDCNSTLVVYNPGPDPARLLIVAQPVRAADDPEGDVACARDFVVECTGLVPPHQPWRWTLPDTLADGAALTVLALEERPLLEDGMDAPGSHADWLCATLERELAGGCLRWPSLLEAWRDRTAYLPHPADPSGPAVLPIRVGLPVFAERWVTCGEVATVAAARTGHDLGWAPPAEIGGDGGGGEAEPRAWTYGLPLPAAAAHVDGRAAPGEGPPGDGDGSGGVGSSDDTGPILATVQTTTGLETTIDVAWLREADGAPFPCGRWVLPAGDARTIDLAGCVREGLATDGSAGSDAAGALRFLADQPVAIVAQVAARDGDLLPASLPAHPLVRNDPRSRPPLHAVDEVAFAPLLYHGVDGWHTRLRVHNPDVDRLARVYVEIIDRSGNVVAMRILGRLRPGASHTVLLDDLPELVPGVYQARVRRIGAAVAPTLTPGSPLPRPTATITPERTALPSATPPATRSAPPTRLPLPTATVALRATPEPGTERRLWLPRLEGRRR